MLVLSRAGDDPLLLLVASQLAQFSADRLILLCVGVIVHCERDVRQDVIAISACDCPPPIAGIFLWIPFGNPFVSIQHEWFIRVWIIGVCFLLLQVGWVRIRRSNDGLCWTCDLEFLTAALLCFAIGVLPITVVVPRCADIICKCELSTFAEPIPGQLRELSAPLFHAGGRPLRVLLAPADGFTARICLARRDKIALSRCPHRMLRIAGAPLIYDPIAIVIKTVSIRAIGQFPIHITLPFALVVCLRRTDPRERSRTFGCVREAPAIPFHVRLRILQRSAIGILSSFPSRSPCDHHASPFSSLSSLDIGTPLTISPTASIPSTALSSYICTSRTRANRIAACSTC